MKIAALRFFAQSHLEDLEQKQINFHGKDKTPDRLNSIAKSAFELSHIQQKIDALKKSKE